MLVRQGFWNMTVRNDSAHTGARAPRRRSAAGASAPVRLSGYAATLLFATALAACGGNDGTSSSDGGPGVTPPQGDPLAQYQWHLKNTGQANFSDRGGTPGIDLDVQSLFDQGETGDGVRVLVLDDGLDIRHPDLKARIASDMLYNFDPNAADVADPTPVNDDAHGTAVAGIIGATANNGIGVRGVAPGVRLGGARYLCSYPDGRSCDSLINTLNALGGAPFSQTADVINGSFGIAATALPDFDPDSSVTGVALQRLATLRNGKGTVFVKSAGNGYGSLDGGDCSDAERAGVTCSNPAVDPMNTMPQTMVVGAVNADGVKSSYSSAGASLLVAGLGGEYGYKGDTFSGPALMTTDLSGCKRGYVKTGQSSENPFNDPATAIARALNPDCDYTATMNGTSAAAPTVSGVVALLLHVNPQLTWRDVRTILMATSRRIDPDRVAKSVTLPDGETYVPEPAWTRNGAGRWFDNWYGFGLVDAAAAVSMAKRYSTYLTGPMKRVSATAAGAGCPDQATCGDDIAPGTADGLSVPLQVDGTGVGTIESVQVTVQLGEVAMRDLAVELISPAGTRSVLLNAFSGLGAGLSSPKDLTLSSNAFNGEAAHGVWQLRLIDVAQRSDPVAGSFKGGMLHVMGH
jgi:subtilisin family serine protease